MCRGEQSKDFFFPIGVAWDYGGTAFGIISRDLFRGKLGQSLGVLPNSAKAGLQ